ncbi:preprotein translocase subunit SecB [Negadavirga shengliensis]|uniref:Preprotein translocase subunit SecB n=1 Tax=Negadavirga shengliensis TaxID=1389218 RepID=A0ABV9SZ95_9BACT
MKARFSPLQLLDFKLLQSHYEFIVPKEDEVDLQDLFQSYLVEIDFSIGRNEEQGEIQVFTKLEVNRDKDANLPGYKMMVEGGGTFRIQNADKLEEGLKVNLTQFSTLNMMINNLRNILYQLTNLGPMGGYLLPPIDITKLLMDKAEEQKGSH